MHVNETIDNVRNKSKENLMFLNFLLNHGHGDPSGDNPILRLAT